MKWKNGFLLVGCAVLLTFKAFNLTLNPQNPFAFIQGKLPSKELEMSIDWAKQTFQAAQEDPQFTELLQSFNAAPRQSGCAAQAPNHTSGFNTAQWLEFKRRAQPGLDQENVIALLGVYYCPVGPDAIRRQKYKALNQQGKVQVMRWLPANELSRENVLDIYFQDRKLLTYELYRLK